MLMFALTWLAAYLIGAIPFGYLVCRARGVDIFAHGSGNIGATNVGRVLGRRFGILVFVLDFAKGALPVAAVLALTPSRIEGLPAGSLEVGAGLAAFLGHLFPIYLGFRGGKGVATGAGVVAVLCPWPALVALATWVVVAVSTRFVSLASIVAAVVLCVVQVGLVDPPALPYVSPRNWFCLVTAGLIVVRHRSNLTRLLQGQENRLKESSFMNDLAKGLHLFALALWFGTCIFFTFVVALTLFRTFESAATAEVRPNWFPLPAEFAKVDDNINGPREQGSRAAGAAVGTLFPWYFLIQGACALVTLLPALGWSRTFPGRVHRVRANVLLVALVLVLVGWKVERRVSEVRIVRSQATDAYLKHDAGSSALQTMQVAREEFGAWHTLSLLLNFATILFVTVAMATAVQLPSNESTLTRSASEAAPG